MGSGDSAAPDAPSVGMLVGDDVGTGPWTATIGLGVVPLAVSPARDGDAVGADENMPP